MPWMNIARGVAWVAAVVTWWSLNLLWGDDPSTGSGPPGQWQRHVVGAGTLALIAALVLSFAGRGGRPPSWLARVIALAATSGMLAISLFLRGEAAETFPHLVQGPGWAWMSAGGGLMLAAVTLTFAIPAPAPIADRARATKKRRRKKRS